MRHFIYNLGYVYASGGVKSFLQLRKSLVELFVGEFGHTFVVVGFILLISFVVVIYFS